MFSTSSSRPSHQSHDIDHSHSHGSYTNLGQQATEWGTINNINVNHQTMNYQYSFSSPIEELEKRCSHSAAFDSAARFNPPRCAESTRLGIIQIIEQWINSDGDGATPSSLFWLYGGAGVGKSALAQSLSEKYQEKKELAASFFFFRSDASRNNGAQLIPTLVSHLVNTFEDFGPSVEDRIRKNRAIFTKTPEVQVKELLIEPLLALYSKGHLLTHPRIVVIDGLDECVNPDFQSELIRVIAGAIPQIPYPLRFLITSRPEAHITRVFNHDHDLQAITVLRYNLSKDPDADMDIRKFLEKEFVEIHRVHCLGRHLGHDWPGAKSITSLVERSSGHFIYASTVIRYIRSPKHRPDDRLEVILRLRPPQEGDRPYAQLDALYELIFQCIESRSQLERVCLVLGILYFQSRKVGYFSQLVAGGTIIQSFLEMKAGDLVLLLDPILSLIAIDRHELRILHKSLFDYLLDSTRGGHLPFDLALVHESAAIHILKNCSREFFQEFAYHCQYARHGDALKAYLNSPDVPCPKSVMMIPKVFPPWCDDRNTWLEVLIWYFFRALSREDPDVHDQYVRKWMSYLHSVVPMRNTGNKNGSKSWSKLLKKSKPPTEVARVGSLKLQLDRLLMDWKPRNCNSLDFGTEPEPRVAMIRREHTVFSAYAQASFTGNAKAIASSLVFGDYFIHSYHFGIGREDSFLSLQTYSKYGSRCYREVYPGEHDHTIAEMTMSYLKRAERYLFSDFYQKYGIEPDEVWGGF